MPRAREPGDRGIGVRDGYFAGQPTAVTQTKDGFLWIGTQTGLLPAAQPSGADDLGQALLRIPQDLGLIRHA